MAMTFLKSTQTLWFHQKINEKIVFEVVNPTSNIKKKSRDKNLNVIAFFLDSLYISKVITLREAFKKKK